MAKVRYTWLSEQEGGRRLLPIGPAMRIQIRLASRRAEFEDIAWDVLFRFDCPPKRNEEQFGFIEYCSQRAPHDSLISGEEFELMEGKRVTVRGVIL